MVYSEIQKIYKTKCIKGGRRMPHEIDYDKNCVDVWLLSAQRESDIFLILFKRVLRHEIRLFSLTSCYIIKFVFAAQQGVSEYCIICLSFYLERKKNEKEFC